MKKKNIKIIICIVIILIALAVIALILINNKNRLENRKKLAIDNTTKLVELLTNNCNLEETKTRRYVIKDSKLDVDELPNIVLPENGIIEFDDECKVNLSLEFDSFYLTYDNEVKLVDNTSTEIGTVIYYDPINNKKCSNYEEENSNTNKNDGCMKWYTLKDNKTTLTVLLDHNILATERYNNVSDKLDNLTSNYIITPRLLNLNDINNLLNVKIKEEDFFFDSKLSDPLKSCYKGDTSNCRYSYLYDRTSLDAKEYGAFNNSDLYTYGYWLEDSKDDKAYRVYKDGRVTLTSINDVSTGIRPVLEIIK